MGNVDTGTNDTNTSELKTSRLKTEFLGWEIDYPATNGSGPFSTTSNDLIDLSNTNVGFITTKTITFNERKGNAVPRIYINDNFTLNSEGLPNPGYKKMAETLKDVRSKTKKKIIASLGPFSIHEMEPIMNELEPYVDGFELNLSCPNIDDGRTTAANKPIVEWMEMFRDLTSKKTIVKLPPYLETGALEEMAEIIIKTRIDALATINSLGNALVINGKKPVLANTWGGLAGKCIKPIGLGNVHRFYKFFKEIGAKVEIIGIGGISSGRDAFEYLLSGANVVGISSAYMLNKKNAFNKIMSELNEILDNERYSSLSKVVGKLEVDS